MHGLLGKRGVLAPRGRAGENGKQAFHTCSESTTRPRYLGVVLFLVSDSAVAMPKSA